MRKNVWLASALLGAGCTNPLAEVAPGTAPNPPEQTAIEEPSFTRAWGETSARITPRARYRVDAVVLIKDTSMDDAWSDVAGLDVALGWGPMASGPLLSQLSFHLKRRYVSVRWGGDFPLGSRDVMQHLSNHHLIAASAEVATQLAKLRPGQHVTLDGRLVDLEVGGQTIRTSLTRDDIGNGACEVLLVESVALLD